MSFLVNRYTNLPLRALNNSKQPGGKQSIDCRVVYLHASRRRWSSSRPQSEPVGVDRLSDGLMGLDGRRTATRSTGSASRSRRFLAAPIHCSFVRSRTSAVIGAVSKNQ